MAQEIVHIIFRYIHLIGFATVLGGMIVQFGEKMSKKSKWEEFFDSHAPDYDQNVFTKNTTAEIGFLIEELGVDSGATILDVGCGTGRHSVELAKLGYRVTGIDLSAGMLDVAKRKAREAGVDVRWVRTSASEFSFETQFDAAICLCEGAFGLDEIEIMVSARKPAVKG